MHKCFRIRYIIKTSVKMMQAALSDASKVCGTSEFSRKILEIWRMITERRSGARYGGSTRRGLLLLINCWDQQFAGRCILFQFSMVTAQTFGFKKGMVIIKDFCRMCYCNKNIKDFIWIKIDLQFKFRLDQFLNVDKYVAHAIINSTQQVVDFARSKNQNSHHIF